MNSKLLRETEARIRKTHAGKGALAVPPSKGSVRDERRAAIAPAVNRALGGKK